MTIKYAVKVLFVLWLSAGAVAEESVSSPVPQTPQVTEARDPLMVSAISAPAQTLTLGGVYEPIARIADSNKYKMEVELTSQGAAVRQVRLAEFGNLDKSAPAPLTLLHPQVFNGKELYSLACESLYVARAGEPFTGLVFPLNKLSWRVAPSEVAGTAVFVAELGDVQTSNDVQTLTSPILRITRTWSLAPGGYDLLCSTQFENLGSDPIKIQFTQAGPVGLSHEGQQRDLQKTYAAYEGVKGEVLSRYLDTGKLQKSIAKKKFDQLKMDPPKNGGAFLWAGVTNKFFTAIIYPAGETAMPFEFDVARYYPAIKDVRQSENASFILKSQTIDLAAAGLPQAAASVKMNVYLGPKDKQVFEGNTVYNKFQLIQTLEFMSCCCPAWMIGPLALGIVWLMDILYTLMGPIGNYGVVIMILVVLVRILLHPLTRHGQIHMMKMQKIMPKYQEMQKRMGKDRLKLDPEAAAITKEMMRGQMMGMAPMFIQMPIWISLWTAVNINVNLRGAGFLPFWITDLSGPDAIFSFRPIPIPLLGEFSSINILPLLMGVVMYFQMKLTPTSQTTAQTNPEMAQQQKIMSVMMVAMFPIMLYNGPSGVNLYIMASMAAGVVEQYVIRKHLKEQQEIEEETLVPATAKIGKVKKKKPKPMFRFDR